MPKLPFPLALSPRFLLLSLFGLGSGGGCCRRSLLPCSSAVHYGEYPLKASPFCKACIWRTFKLGGCLVRSSVWWGAGGFFFSFCPVFFSLPPLAKLHGLHWWWFGEPIKSNPTLPVAQVLDCKGQVIHRHPLPTTGDFYTDT